MLMPKEINDRISFLPSSEDPLSADVYIIRGNKRTYVVDVGSSDEAWEYLSSLGKKAVVITHFHDDHMKNLRRLVVADEDLFISAQSRKVLATGAYTAEMPRKSGIIVTDKVEISDGVRLVIVPMPSSHAKGSLAVSVDEEYLFLGDGFYCSSKGYNVSLLSEQIKALKDLSFTRVIMSHDEKVYSRDEVISELEAIYGKRTKESPYIAVSRWN